MSITQENAIRALLADYSETDRMVWKAIQRTSFESTSILTRVLVHIERRTAQEIDRMYQTGWTAKAEPCVTCGSWTVGEYCQCHLAKVGEQS